MKTKTISTRLSAMDVAQRLDRLRERFDYLQVDALVITNLANIRYLTGFSGSAAMLIVTQDQAMFTSDGRYGLQSETELKSNGVKCERVIGGMNDQKDAIVKVASNKARVGLEAASITWQQQQTFAKDWFADAALVSTKDAVEHLRLIKDQGEVSRIARACAIADAALAEVAPLLNDQPTEREFAIELDFKMRTLGADELSFETIVATARNGAKAHHKPSGEKIRPGELTVIDFGALVDGYHSDMTRTLCVGEPANDTLQRMYDVVIESQGAGAAAVRAGATCAEVDLACREVISQAGWADAFTHSTGHGVGLDIHESPTVHACVTDSLEPGHVVTVEPGVYLQDFGGVRIEDTVVVEQDGCVCLTNAPKLLSV